MLKYVLIGGYRGTSSFLKVSSAKTGTNRNQQGHPASALASIAEHSNTQIVACRNPGAQLETAKHCGKRPIRGPG